MVFQNKLVFSVGFHGTLFALFLFFFTPRMSFDDVQMSLIVSGLHYAQKPSELLLFSHVWLGLLFKHLYQSFPQLAWYGSYLFFSAFLAFSGLLKALLEYEFSKEKFILYLSFFVLFGSYVLLFPTFTTIAAFSGLAGWLVWFSAKKSINFVFSGILLVNSFLLRNDSFLLASLFFLSFAVLALYYSNPKKNNFSKTKLYFSFLLLLGVGSLYYADWQYYQQKQELENGKKYLSNITKILDFNYLPYGAYRHAYEKVGWTDNDHKMLRSWYFMDTTVFGQETMQKALAEVDVLSLKFVKQRGIKENIRELFLSVFTSEYAILSLVFSLFLVFFPHFSFPKLAFFLLGFCLTSMSFFILMMFRKLPLNHVGFLHFAFLPLLILFFSNFYSQKNAVFSVPHFFQISFLLVAIIYSFSIYYPKSVANRVNITAYSRLMKGLEKDKLYVSWSYSPIYHGYGCFENSLNFKGIDLLHVGTFNYPPIVGNTLAKYTIKDLYTDVIDNQKVIFISDTLKLGYLAKYLEEHYKREVTWQKQKDLEGLEFYQIISKN